MNLTKKYFESLLIRHKSLYGNAAVLSPKKFSDPEYFVNLNDSLLEFLSIADRIVLRKKSNTCMSSKIVTHFYLASVKFYLLRCLHLTHFDKIII
jgi:hypothetical protein